MYVGTLVFSKFHQIKISGHGSPASALYVGHVCRALVCWFTCKLRGEFSKYIQQEETCYIFVIWWLFNLIQRMCSLYLFKVFSSMCFLMWFVTLVWLSGIFWICVLCLMSLNLWMSIGSFIKKRGGWSLNYADWEPKSFVGTGANMERFDMIWLFL